MEWKGGGRLKKKKGASNLEAGWRTFYDYRKPLFRVRKCTKKNEGTSPNSEKICAAATFSFLIAIPAILGAAVLETWSLFRETSLSSEPWSVYGVGAGVAFVVGVVALRALCQWKGVLELPESQHLARPARFCGVVFRSDRTGRAAAVDR